MLLPRRKFLASSLLFGASAFLVLNTPSQGLGRALAGDDISPDVLRDPVYSFTRETFEPYVGGYFEVPNARGEMVAMKLLKVESYTPDSDTKISTGRPATTDAFSLLFSAAAALPTLKTVHTVSHGALGDFNLFLTRKNGPSREIYYEAVFNHLR